MRKKLHLGLLTGAILLAPLATAIPASAEGLPLEPADPTAQVASPGCPGGAPHWSCILESLSAGGSNGQ